MTVPDHKVNVDEAKAILSQLNALDLQKSGSHQDFILKCQSLIDIFQKPGDKALEILTSFTVFPCLHVASDLGIFEKLSKGPLTARQLAEQTGADLVLVARLMRVIVGAKVVAEIDSETYAPTPISNLYATSAYAAGFGMYGAIVDKLGCFPEYLRETNYRNPADHENGIFQYCFRTNLTTFQWINQNPEVARDFNLFMTTRHAQQHWSDTYPVWKAISDGVTLDAQNPLVVDVGGGMGHDLQVLKTKLPSIRKGQLIVEDQASVIDAIPADMQDPDLQYVKYDFFTPQPVHGARVYLLKSIIHNWPDHKAVDILRNVASGMKRGYSKVWLFGAIVPDTNAPQMLAGLDIIMMVLLAAMERTKQHIAELLDKAGMVLTDVQMVGDGYGVIEAMLK
ncbi:putative O-methyltransferase [Aspergillus fischeri NRRL 181]|uniref:O-methyltransferase, putative n=1 Tax=Neosartorya fischeri (strain ATCC 1020 / DSM 3700 / CBS 544.65 / FGSC A1164 / JCM 1740 / NRRL 181 / WB 181) TaxID=331117 RepID=A1DNT1_NEOFI|nr:O-methyltransferase, putative [Aspergillus fischeri NRRL 181]EAW16452.1 O-methyltransferase, putative [Aspergillus fischeri NRRL 181]KAG2024255.1 hypothetical protein GB937_003905 [Aspergillus fischeri]